MSQSLAPVRRALKGRLILVIPYCHPDWAWTHTRRWHQMRYVLAMEEVLDILNAQDAAGVPADAPEAFRWYLDVYCTQFVEFRRARPQRLKELRRRIAEGRVAVCGAYSNVRINHVEGETFVRTLIYGRRAFARELPEADLSVHADSVDTAVGHPQLPQILTQAGYRGFQFWRPNDALHAKGVPYYFVWEGLDGSRILCNRGCYGGLTSPALVPRGEGDWDAVVAAWWEQALKERVAHSPADVLTAQHGCDDARPLRSPPHSDEPLDLPAAIAAWNEREDSTIRFATPVEVFRELEKRRRKLPVVKGTLDPCDVAYNAAWFGSHGLWKLRSECARALCASETLHALGRAAGAVKTRPAQIQAAHEALWGDTLLFSAHAIQWLFQDDFDEIYDLAQRTLSQTRKMQRDALDALAERIRLPERAVSIHYNPLPHERDAAVPARVTFVRGDEGAAPETMRLVDARGEEVPWQKLGEMSRGRQRWEIDALVKLRLPACGWNVLRWEPGEPSFQPDAAGEPNVLENDALRLHFHLGRLVKIEEKTRGAAWEAPDDTPFGHLRAYLVDTTAPLHVGPILGRLDAEWTSWRVTERGPVRWTMRSEGRVGPHAAALETRLYRGDARVEFHAEIDWVGMNGFLASHTPYPGPGRLWGDMPFCVEEKDLTNEPYVGIERRREGLFIAQSFVDWRRGHRGLAYLSHDGDRYYIYDAAAASLAHILINSVRRPADTWERHVNEQMEGVGRHEFTYSLAPHAGSWRDARLWRLAAELRSSALAAWPTRSGREPAWRSLLRVEPDHVTLSACYLEEGRMLLRLTENAGKSAAVKIALPARAKRAEPVNLLGEPVKSPKANLRGETLSLRLRPWRIATIAVEF